MRRTIRQLLAFSGAVVLLGGCGDKKKAPPFEQPPEELAKPEVIVIPSDWRAGQPFDQRFEDETPDSIDLAATRFDPVGTTGEASTNGAFAPDLVRDPFTEGDDDLFVVQASSPIAQVALRTDLEGQGIEIAGYIPERAYLVRLTSTERAGLAARSDVTWIGLMQPGWRIAPKLEWVVLNSEPRILRVTALFDPAVLETQSDVWSAASAGGFGVIDIVRRSHDWKVRLWGSTTDVARLAATRGCTWVERFAGYVWHNNVARSSASTVTGRGGSDGPVMDVEDVWARGIRGEGQVASAADTGLSTGDMLTLHSDFGECTEVTSGSCTAKVASNPMRLKAAYARGRAGDWSDDQAQDGGHGTHTSGSIVGNGIRSGADPATNTFPSTSYAGVAPKAELVFQSVLDSSGGLGGLPSDLNVLFKETWDDGARVHSNSWGSAVAGDYTTDSQDVDEFTWDYPTMVITFSAGNEGEDGRYWNGRRCTNRGGASRDGIIDDDSMGAPGTAKDCITVGATENYRPNFVYEFPAEDCTSGDGIEQVTWGWFGCYENSPIQNDEMTDDASGLGAFSSRGPTSDGRFKPDVVAPGIGIISTRTDLNQTYEQWGICDVEPTYRPYYVTQGGTSMSNPLTAGAAVLVRQYYFDGWHAEGSVVTNLWANTSHKFDPSAALVKATLINGAWDMTPGQYGTGTTQEIPPGWDTGATIPDNASGFGRVDLEAALFPGSGYNHDSNRQMWVFDETTGLSTSGVQNYTVSVDSSAGPLKATLVWSDPYGATGAGATLVNNLDLLAISPGSTPFFPNGVNKTSGADSDNNVEQVIVSGVSLETGDWTIRVTGTGVPGNAQTGSTTQPYALVISAVMPQQCTTPGAPTGAQAAPNGNNRIDLQWSGSADSYVVYRSETSGGPYTRIAQDIVHTGNPMTYNDSVGVVAGVTYYYVVTAVNSPSCESAQPAEVYATALGTCTLAPTFGGLETAQSAQTGSCMLRLEWNVGTNNCGAGALVYNVYRSATSGFTPSAGTLLQPCLSDLFYEDTGVADGETWYYVVRAEDHTSSGGGQCQSGNEDTNTVEVSGEPFGLGVTTVLHTFNFDGSGMDGWGTYDFGSGLASNWQGIVNCDPPNSNIFRFGGDTDCTTDYDVDVFEGAYPRDSNGIDVPAGATNTTMTFDHRWVFEASYDGALLALTLDKTAFFAVQGSALTGTGYNDVTGRGYSAFSGTQSTMTSTTAALDAACEAASGVTGGCAGQTIWPTFVGDSDTTIVADGWFLDNIVVSADVPGACGAPPGPVQFFTATSISGQNRLDWLNPSGTQTATMIRFGTDDFPTDSTDGTLVVDQADGAGTHGTTNHSVTNGVTYYYAAFVRNGTSYSSRKTVAATPFSSSTVHWAYVTGAASMAPPGIGSIYAVSNDRVLHSMQVGDTAGYWPTTWTPLAMNAPSQARPIVVPVSLGGATKVVFVSSQDGGVYAIDADTGTGLWSPVPDLGSMLVASPAGSFSAWGGHDVILVGTRDSSAANALHAIRLSDGVDLTSGGWPFDNGGDPNGIGIISGTAAIDYGPPSRVYFTSRSRSANTIWCVGFDADGVTGSSSGNIGASDVGPTLSGGTLYAGNNNGQVYAIDPADCSTVWGPVSTSDGPVKESLWVENGNVIFSTSNRVWSIDAATGTTTNWDTALVSPSAPLIVPGAGRAWVGSGDGNLYQLDLSDGAATPTTLGYSTAAVGSPALDTVNNRVHVGTEAGTIFSVTDQ